jgi:hypothetical protein
VHPHLDALVGALDPAEPVDEVHVPRRAPELAVRRRLQPHALLHRDDVPDRLVLSGAQCRDVDLTGLVRGARREQCGGPEQASDVVGTERRFGGDVMRSRPGRSSDGSGGHWAGWTRTRPAHRITELVERSTGWNASDANFRRRAWPPRRTGRRAGPDGILRRREARRRLQDRDASRSGRRPSRYQQ